MNSRSLLRPALAAIVAAVVALCGTACARSGSQRAAVEKAIREHLDARSDLALNQMAMQLGEVKVDGDAAGAEVVFSTHTDPPARMSYHYELRKEAGNWQVTGGWPSGTSAGAQHPTMGSSEDSGGVPPGEMPSLPAGHPPIPGMQTSTATPQH